MVNAANDQSSLSSAHHDTSAVVLTHSLFTSYVYKNGYIYTETTICKTRGCDLKRK